MQETTKTNPAFSPGRHGDSFSYAAEIEGFRLEIQKAGLIPPPDIQADGEFHRFSTNGRPNDDAGWYILNRHPILAGAFGCWRSGLKQPWSAVEVKGMTKTERKQYQETMERIHVLNQQKRAEAQSKAAGSAKRIWDNAQEASVDHPYLKIKQISPIGLKQKEDQLLAPMRNQEGQVLNLQRINPGGSKRFLKNGQVKGLYHILGEPSGVVYIGEGYATMDSVHRATDRACVVAFNAGNLKEVSRVIRGAHPEAEIVICADDDHMTEGNPGMAKAREAALEVKASVAVPDFGENRGRDQTDFNDLLRLKGMEAVRTCLDNNRLTTEEVGRETDLAILAELAGNWEVVLPPKSGPPYSMGN